MCGVTIISYINYGVQLWCVILLYDDFVGQIHGFKFAHLEYIMNESITYVRRTNKMHTFFINDLIQLYHDMFQTTKCSSPGRLYRQLYSI